jgi:putative transposase
VRKRVRSTKSKPGPRAVSAVSQQRVLQLAQILVGAQDALHEVIVDVGQQVLAAMLEQDREALCGAKGRRDPDRDAYRYGHNRGHMVLGGRKIEVEKPRVRRKGGQEVQLPSWQQFRKEDPLDVRTLSQMLIGVSTRKYERSLETLPAGMNSIATKKSSVSRRFVRSTKAAVEAFLSRELKDLDLPVLMIDGKYLGPHLLIFALGIDATGKKHVLGIWEGSTESHEVCKSLLRDLIERGLKVERPRLIVLDGGKGLRKAVGQVFGRFAVVQRCQVHKLRNVLEHLPEDRRSWVKANLVRAWKSEDVEKARTALKRLVSSLEEDHPGAAASLEEGLSETLTLVDLGLGDGLRRTLKSTNPIENLNATMERSCSRVCRWKNASMARRWAVSAALEAESGFRRIRGHEEMPQLLAALESKINPVEVSKELKVA